MVVNRRYPCSFRIYKSTITGGGPGGGGVQGEDVALTGNCSLQKGNIRNENVAVTYKWMVCFNLNDRKSIPAKPTSFSIDNSYTIEVTDVLGNTHTDTISEQFHSDLGSTIYFGEINENE